MESEALDEKGPPRNMNGASAVAINFGMVGLISGNLKKLLWVEILSGKAVSMLRINRIV